MPMTFEDFEKACAVTGALILRTYPGLPGERNEGAEWTPTHLLWMLAQAVGAKPGTMREPVQLAGAKQ